MNLLLAAPRFMHRVLFPRFYFWVRMLSSTLYILISIYVHVVREFFLSEAVMASSGTQILATNKIFFSKLLLLNNPCIGLCLVFYVEDEFDS